MGSVGMTRFFEEIRRRRLFGVLALYVIGSWIVLQVAATLFPGWRIPDEAIRFVWIGTLLLFPVAVLFGWRYDISPKGVRRTPAIDASNGDSALTRKDFGVLSFIALVGASICFGVAKEILDSRVTARPVVDTTDIPQNSIAVLPFVNMSDDPDNEYFSDGVSEQLLNGLARVPDLHVAARTSSFYYKDKSESMQTMGRELGVRTLLEGSVRKAGNSVRITAQLINADDGYHIWSDTYDSELDDIFAVQDEIASAIVSTLKIELMLQAQVRLEQPPTDNAEAYDIYLRAMAYRMSPEANSLETSNGLLQDAIEMAPDFALAYDALAYGYLLKSFAGSMSVDEATRSADLLLEEALKLQPDLEQAHASLGLLKSRLKRYVEANVHYETALAINPNYFGAQVNYGLSLVHQSRLKEASAAYLRAQALDPLNANLNSNLGALLMLMGQFENGYQFIQKSTTIDPGFRAAEGAKTHWLGIYGRLVEAVQNGHETLQRFPDFAPNIRALVSAYTKLGMMDEAEQILTNAQASMPENGSVRNAQVDFWLADGNYDAFSQFAEDEFELVDVQIGDPLNYTNSMRAYRHGWSKLIGGDNELASELFYWVAGGEEGIATKTYDEINVLKMLALSYRRMQRFDEANALLNQCLRLIAGSRENGWATPSLYVRLAEVHALLGDVENAIVNLEIAFSKGWRGLSNIEYGVFWQDLQDHDELNRIKIMIYNDLEFQRESLRENLINLESGQVRLEEAA